MIVLVGFMGAGKSTVGRLLAERLELPFADSDVLIEQRLGRTIRDVFSEDGEAAFRELEHRTVVELVGGPDTVVALGGGAVIDPRTRAALRDAQVVYLRVSYDEAKSRVTDAGLRPMMRRPDLEGVYRQRLAVYEGVATVTVETDGRRAHAVVGDVLGQLEADPGPEGERVAHQEGASQ
jgi:shikimate kinase